MTSLIESQNTDSNDFALILFCKAPVQGKVKTRLASDFALAVDLYAGMLQALIQTLHQDLRRRLILAVDTEGLSYFRKRYDQIEIIEQRGADLGERMKDAFVDIFSRKDHSVVILAGSDVPELTSEIAAQMALHCQKHDAVLLPAGDGGYSAIALHRSTEKDLRRFFSDIAWSTASVLDSQIERFIEAGKSVYCMPEVLEDIDVLEDVLRLRKRCTVSGFPFLAMVPSVVAILPVLNEEESLPSVLPGLLNSIWIDEVICVDNGSTDRSVDIIERSGATLIQCAERGYGAAMLAGIARLANRPASTIVLFLDADGSDDQLSLPDLLKPVFSGKADLVLGARQGRLLPHQSAGNRLAVWLIRLIWKHTYADLGPFRAIRLEALHSLKMDDRNFGWTIQMQIRAVQKALRIDEISVRSLKRIAGRSKVSGTIRGTLLAGTIILRTVFREWSEQRKGFTDRQE